MLSKARTVFLLKIAGIVGACYSGSLFVEETLVQANVARINSNLYRNRADGLGSLWASFKEHLLGESDYLKKTLVFVFIYLIFLTLYIIGKYKESQLDRTKYYGRSLDYQASGVMLISLGIISIIESVNFLQLYLSSKENNDLPRLGDHNLILEYYFSNLLISLITVLIPIMIGSLLLLVKYKKQIVFDVTT